MYPEDNDGCCEFSQDDNPLESKDSSPPKGYHAIKGPGCLDVGLLLSGNQNFALLDGQTDYSWWAVGQRGSYSDMQGLAGPWPKIAFIQELYAVL